MQDILLRVFMVTVGLLTCLRDDPEPQDWDDSPTVPLQIQEDRLVVEDEKLHHIMTSVNKEMTHDDNRGPLNDGQNIDNEENQARNVPVMEDLSHHKPSQIDQEHKEKSEMDIKNEQGEEPMADSSFRDQNRPKVTQVKPEENTVLHSEDKESPPSHVHTKTSENETSEVAITDWERDFLWYLWNTFSIISFIRFLRKYLGRNSQIKEGETCVFPGTCNAVELPRLDSDTLQRFHTKYVNVSSSKMWKEEFLEGFTNDLLEVMKTVCDKNGGMAIGDFRMVDVYNIIVPFTPPDRCSFQCSLWNNQASDLLPDMQVCGQIKLVENKVIQDSCPCQSPDADDDMVCLLHCEQEKVQIKVCDDHLCGKNSSFLSKSQVTRWFQSTIKQAWAQISHKYEFELNIRYIDAPGALVVRFRSGKKICFSMNPVVRFNNDAHFIITTCSPPDLDTFWTLSLITYEDQFFKNMSEHLPKNSCHSQTLEIARFLHRRQTALSGSTTINDFHFKTALMHLLLTTEPSQWEPDHVASRLQDLLAFMGRSLEKKLLHHAIIGNPLTQRVIELPAEFSQTKPVNLFHPLVVHSCIYRNAVMHFQEMLKNAQMLIQEYICQCMDN
ncbi:inositol 1,4,5-trisphosphate receptor-interacting protein [Cheilinus undulatus]|uniref:inositol 1,4,5-trisphosphate receptor-interacting protein n=1 Tax=Cheilinus undulatus TaxID=241271 RepID=UPI001BD4F8AF|nr:inositol 1,4,5-trisphosphate receptor-interacting protein [Cheilinus undulatus]